MYGLFILCLPRYYRKRHASNTFRKYSLFSSQLLTIIKGLTVLFYHTIITIKGLIIINKGLAKAIFI